MNITEESLLRNDWNKFGSQEWLKNEAIGKRLWYFSWDYSRRPPGDVNEFNLIMSLRMV